MTSRRSGWRTCAVFLGGYMGSPRGSCCGHGATANTSRPACVVSGTASLATSRHGIRPMRVLAHIHTFNDADIIERTVAAVLGQTRRPDAVLIVDNASSDATLDRTFPDEVSVMRHTE